MRGRLQVWRLGKSTKQIKEESADFSQTVIVIYEPGDIELDADLVKNSVDENCETLMKVGWRVGEKR